jgi:hypothetical protein
MLSQRFKVVPENCVKPAKILAFIKLLQSYSVIKIQRKIEYMR